jgi:TonB-linked SusC/RagA family outer membrane protein
MENKILKLTIMVSKQIFYWAIILIVTAGTLWANSGNAQGTIKSVKENYISLSLKDASLFDVIKAIEDMTGYKFTYDRNEIDRRLKMQLHYENASVEEVLLEVSKNAKLKFQQINNNIHVKKLNSGIEVPKKIEVIIQTRNVSGRVISQDDGQGLPGVNVIERGTLNGTVTDVDGRYSLTVSEGATLSFSSVGYVLQEMPIGNRAAIDITMILDVKTLEELVVVGYGIQEKMNITGSITQINASELTTVPMPTISQGIMGRSPGVFIKNKQGQPGEDGVDINIRGFGTPLIIVDGSPVSLSYFQQLEASEIESLNVLKDAASAAVYGARAGNGVILVTTKRGRVSPPEFTFSVNSGLQFITQMQQPVSSYQYAAMENVALMNEGKEPKWTSEDIQKLRDGSDPINFPNTDFVKAVLRQYAPQYQTNLNVRGGSESSKYFTSISFYEQRGMVKSDEISHKRFALRSNIDIALTKKLDAGLDLSFTNQDYIGPRFDLEQKFASEEDVNIRTGGIMNRILRSRSYYSIAPYPDPTKPVWGGNTATNNPVNMMYMDEIGFKKRTTLYGYGKLNFTYTLPAGFKAKAAFDLNRTYHRFKDKGIKLEEYEYNRVNDEYIVRNILNDDAQLFERNSLRQNINQQYFLTWDRQFNDHNFSALFVHERLMDDYDIYWASRRDFAFPINYLDGGPDENKDNGGYGTQLRRMAYVSRVTYNYRNKYMFEFNSRWDATDNFPPDTRWGFFPSASVAWRLSEENFIKDNVRFMDNLKIRASHGNLGYDRIGDFAYLATYSVNSKGYMFEDNKILPSINEDRMPNRFITWEKMTSSNFGIDFQFFGNQIEGSMDYFYRKRTDVLGDRQVSLPNVVGVQMPRENINKFDNRGWELVLNHNRNLGSVNWSIGGNVAWNREKTLWRDEPEYSTMEAWRRGTQIGQWTDRWWMLPTAGLFKTQEEIDNWADIDGQGNRSIKPGDVKFIDTDEDGRITNEDMIIAGRGVFPRFFYGLQTSVSWKGFDMNMLWQGAGLYNFNLRHSTGYLSMPFYSGISPQTFMYYNYYTPENPWIPTNTNARWPIYRDDRTNRDHQRSYRESQHWLIDGSYIRLKNIEIGYTFPAVLTNRLGINNFRLYVSGYNVLTFSQLSDYLDPEIDTHPSTQFGDYHPPLGMYNVGAVIKF